jgi:hypothetical protein
MIGVSLKELARSLWRLFEWFLVPAVLLVLVAASTRPWLLLGVFAAGGFLGLRAGARWRWSLRSRLKTAEARIDAWNRADARTDLDVVGPVTGDQPVLGVDLEPWQRAGHPREQQR